MNLKIPLIDSLPPRKRKLARWTLGLLLAYSLIGFLILPPIIRAVAAKQLAKQLGRDVAITAVRINPFTFSATIRGFLIKDRDGNAFVSWDRVYVNLQLSSFLGHAWNFKEVTTSKPYVRVQMYKDGTFNFSDLVARFSTNAPTKPEPSKPLALRIDHLQIAGAEASVEDLTRQTIFRRVIGPIDVALENFRTDPSNKNPYSFAGTTDAGEKFSWSGYFYLAPLRSEGEFALENLSLNKYTPLYQDFVRFVIRDGVIDFRSNYRFELSPSQRVVTATNSSFHLHSFKLAEPDRESNLVELPDFAVTDASVDALARRAEIGSITASGARLDLRRDKDAAINIVEVAQPIAGMTNASGGILFLLQSVTNAVAQLLNSTNQWSGTIHNVNVTNCAVNLEDLAQSRPVRLQLDQISLAAKEISNLPGTNLTAALSLRWNTNGTIKSEVQASLLPPTADIQIALDQLELRALDPYLEPKLNLFVLDSKLGMKGRIRLRTDAAELPQVTFAGDVRLDDFSTVDGVFAEDLLKWGSLRISGIDANLNPPTVSIQQIAIDDAYARLVIETNRSINLLTALRLSDTNAASGTVEEPLKKSQVKQSAAPIEPTVAATSTNAPTLLPKISIASVIVSNALVRFSDRSLTPGVNLTLQQAGGTISGLSSENLQHAEVNLQARVDNVGPVAITGTINPFRKDSTNDIKISIKNVDLTPASPYVGKFAGYRLAKGKLGMDLAYHLRNRDLKSENLIVLDQFTFGEKVNSPDATKLPVRLAIAILKDRDGKIQLDVPIEGSLDDPQFKLGKVIIHAIGNILTKIATSPFSMLGAVFGGQGEELSYQDFAPGSFELQPAGQQKLDGLAKAFYERPALQLEIEGSIDPVADLEDLRRVALEKRLRTLQWMSLRKSERAMTTADQVILTPEDRASWLKRAYTEALAKGEIILSAASTNQSGSVSNQAQTVSLSAARALAGLSSGVAEKGSTALMRLSSEPPLSQTKASSSTPGIASAKRSPAEEMEALLLNSIEVNERDYQSLAAARAKAVREYLLQNGKVEPERVFLVETQPGGTKSQGSRAYLQLR